ncbi:MFS transporter [Fusibacter sp. A1]|nr:MFS transporter [Fusibacter sp. A1]
MTIQKVFYILLTSQIHLSIIKTIIKKEIVPMKKNIRLYYLYYALSDLLFIGPVIVIYLLSKGFSFTEILALQSIFSIAIFITEVPTGATADKFGRKNSLILGTVFRFLAMLLLIFGKSFLPLALSEILFALGLSLKSGTDSALLYDTMLSLERESDYQRIAGKGHSNLYITQAVASLLAGVMYSYDPHLPFIAATVFVALNGLVCLFFSEPPIHGKTSKHGLGYYDQMKSSFSHVASQKKIIAVILFACVYITFSKTAFWFYTPYFVAVDINVVYYGLMFFLFNIIAAISSRYNHLFIKATRGRTMVVMNLMMVVSFAILGTVTHAIGVMGIFLQQANRGLFKPVVDKYVNKHTASDKRATVLSIVSLMSNLCAAVFMPLFGLVKDSLDVYKTHLTLAATLLIATLFMSYTIKRLQKKAIGSAK